MARTVKYDAGIPACLESGADGIELDVQCTKDGIPVVFHDDRLDDLTDGADRCAAIRSNNCRTRRGFAFRSEWKGERIPTWKKFSGSAPREAS